MYGGALEESIGEKQTDSRMTTSSRCVLKPQPVLKDCWIRHFPLTGRRLPYLILTGLCFKNYKFACACSKCVRSVWMKEKVWFSVYVCV